MERISTQYESITKQKGGENPPITPPPACMSETQQTTETAEVLLPVCILADNKTRQAPTSPDCFNGRVHGSRHAHSTHTVRKACFTHTLRKRGRNKENAPARAGGGSEPNRTKPNRTEPNRKKWNPPPPLEEEHEPHEKPHQIEPNRTELAGGKPNTVSSKPTSQQPIKKLRPSSGRT